MNPKEREKKAIILWKNRIDRVMEKHEAINVNQK